MTRITTTACFVVFTGIVFSTQHWTVVSASASTPGVSDFSTRVSPGEGDKAPSDVPTTASIASGHDSQTFAATTNESSATGDNASSTASVKDSSMTADSDGASTTSAKDDGSSASAAESSSPNDSGNKRAGVDKATTDVFNSPSSQSPSFQETKSGEPGKKRSQDGQSVGSTGHTTIASSDKTTVEEEDEDKTDNSSPVSEAATTARDTKTTTTTGIADSSRDPTVGELDSTFLTSHPSSVPSSEKSDAAFSQPGVTVTTAATEEASTEGKTDVDVKSITRRRSLNDSTAFGSSTQKMEATTSSSEVADAQTEKQEVGGTQTQAIQLSQSSSPSNVQTFGGSSTDKAQTFELVDPPRSSAKPSEIASPESSAALSATRESIQSSEASDNPTGGTDLSFGAAFEPPKRSTDSTNQNGIDADSNEVMRKGTLPTIDSDGLTNNSTQDPDSVTFSPVRVDLTQTADASQPEVQTLSSSGSETKLQFSDREREGSGSAKSGNLSLPDEADREKEDQEETGDHQSSTSDRSQSTQLAKGTTASERDSSASLSQPQQSSVRPVESETTTETRAQDAASLVPQPQRKGEDLSTVQSDASGTSNPPSPNPAPTLATAVLDAADGTTGVGQGQSAARVSTAVEGSTVKASTAADVVKGSVPSDVTLKASVSVSAPESIGSNDTVAVVGTQDKDAVGTDLNLPAQTSTPPSATSRPKIRKPKLKVGGTSTPDAPLTRRPYQPSPGLRPASTTGRPVSVFGRTRTRAPSITSSTTRRPLPRFSTIRIQYASALPGVVPGGELVVSTEPVTTTTTEATTTETEEPFTLEPFSDPTQAPTLGREDNVTLVKVAGLIGLVHGLRWTEQLDNRHSPQFREKAKFVHVQLERLFRTSSIAPRLWKIQIDGFSTKRSSQAVVVDFFLYLTKTKDEVSAEGLTKLFHEKLTNYTFSRFRVDPNQTLFEVVSEEPLRAPTPPPEDDPAEASIPQWAIAVIVVGAASLIFIFLFATVAMIGRHHMRRRYTKKLTDEDSERPGEWERKMAAAYENLAADTIYDADDLNADSYKKSVRCTHYGRKQPTSPPTRPPCRADSWSSSDWSPPPRRPRPQVHRIAY